MFFFFFGGGGGGWGLWSLRAFQNNKIGETLCWYKHDLVLREII